MIRLFVLCLFALWSFSSAMADAEFSGAMAQSQFGLPGDKMGELAPRGATNDPLSGEVLLSLDNGIYKLDKQLSLQRIADIPHAGCRLANDGVRIYAISDYVVVPYENEGGKWVAKKTVYINPAPMRIFVASTSSGWGAKGKFFGYNAKDGKVYAFDAGLKPLGAVFEPPKIEKGSGYKSVAVMPESGDMLLSTEYPDLTVYRFSPDGKQVYGGGWPLRGQYCASGGFALAGGKLFAMHAGISEVPERILSVGDLESAGDGSDMPTFGMASDGADGFYVASACGTKHYPDGFGTEAKRRIGGVGKLKSIAVNSGLVVFITDGFLCAMMVDDFSDSAMLSNGREPWRCGANWVSNPEIIAAYGGGFAVYDSKLDCAWAFNPASDGAERWVKIDTAGVPARNFVLSLKRTFKPLPKSVGEHDVCGKWLVGHVPSEKAIFRYKLK